MHFLYILHSKTLDRHYVGETADLQSRLKMHNDGNFKKAFTKAASDWKIVYVKECYPREQARYLERFIKRMKSTKFIRKVIEDPKILDDIWKKRQ